MMTKNDTECAIYAHVMNELKHAMIQFVDNNNWIQASYITK